MTTRPWLSPLIQGLCGLSLLALVTGTTGFLEMAFSKTAPSSPTSKITHAKPPTTPGTSLKSAPKPSPFGVFDLQSGHGKGKWRARPDNLLR